MGVAFGAGQTVWGDIEVKSQVMLARPALPLTREPRPIAHPKEMMISRLMLYTVKIAFNVCSPPLRFIPRSNYDVTYPLLLKGLYYPINRKW